MMFIFLFRIVVLLNICKNFRFNLVFNIRIFVSFKDVNSVMYKKYIIVIYK